MVSDRNIAPSYPYSRRSCNPRLTGAGNTRNLAVCALEQVFKSDMYAENILDGLFQAESLSAVDRRFITELVYGTLRWHGKLDWILRETFHGKWENVSDSIQRLLESALYQILYMDRTPDYATVNETVKLAKRLGGQKWGKTANGLLRTCIRNRADYSVLQLADPVLNLAVNWSHPLWLVRKLSGWLGLQRTELLCRANNKRPYTSLRINRLRTSREQIIAELAGEGFTVESSTRSPCFIKLYKPGNIRELNCFKRGHVTVQDESAGLPAQLMDPQSHELILDLAAAPGGKSTFMAELSRDAAFIVASDRNCTRIRLIDENRKRLELKNLHIMAADATAFCLRPKADKILLDAPCSGLGVIRRKGELRWRKTEKQLKSLRDLQSSLLRAAAGLVKTGGRLVYSTCTILEEENEQIVELFLKENRHFTLEQPSALPDSVVDPAGYVRTWPDRHDMDGSFAAAMTRQE